MKTRINELCRAANVTTAYQLQKLCQLSPSQAARIYNDKVEAISLSVLETLCKALKCTPNDIFGYAPKKESKALFSVRTAAEKLGISESKAWAMIRDGRLPSEKNGGHRSINEKDLAVEFMNKYYKPKKAAK